MSFNTELVNQFFRDLKQYNSTNFRTIEKADFNQTDNATLHKSCSSVVTRFFIFKERHPDISEEDIRILYFKLRIDMIARYFSEYPASSLSDLIPFQAELHRYVERERSSKLARESDAESVS